MLTKYYDTMLKPFDTLDALRMFDDIYTPSWGLKPRSSASSYRVNTTDTGLELSLDLPGVKSRDLSVQVSGRNVSISGKLRGEEFTHTYAVAKAYDVEAIDAALEDGVLTLKFDRVKEASVKTVEVKVK